MSFRWSTARGALHASVNGRALQSRLYRQCGPCVCAGCRPFGGGQPLAGQCYFITDHAPDNSFDFFERHLTALNLTYQTTTLPAGAAQILAQGSELHLLIGRQRLPVLSRYTVAATSRDFWFNHDKAARDFGYAPIISATTRSSARWLGAGTLIMGTDDLTQF
ncbi:MAG: hypothetical protein IPK17_19105 [Chloroflexi bacterium]|uniref:hypothetical protein n=1 Tax=Candidatus Flexifilum breve TaxID=3140694 RepID=UPI003134E27D|nr:hypothetical protein [Chloroflexota bacterium]